MSSVLRSGTSEQRGDARPNSPFEVRGAAPASVADGLLPVRALVVDRDEDPTGFIGVWVKDGLLHQLEYSWVTDDVPMEYPGPDRLRPFPG